MLLLGSIIMVSFQRLLSHPIVHGQNQPTGNKGGATLEYSVLLRSVIPPSTIMDGLPGVVPTTTSIASSLNMGRLGHDWGQGVIASWISQSEASIEKSRYLSL
jgi:hypothetical protein